MLIFQTRKRSSIFLHYFYLVFSEYFTSLNTQLCLCAAYSLLSNESEYVTLQDFQIQAMNSQLLVNTLQFNQRLNRPTHMYPILNNRFNFPTRYNHFIIFFLMLKKGKSLSLSSIFLKFASERGINLFTIASKFTYCEYLQMAQIQL